MAAHNVAKVIATTTPGCQTLIVLQQEQNLDLEATVLNGRTVAIDGPNLEVDWTSLHSVGSILVNVLINTGLIGAELIKPVEQILRGSHGMNPHLKLIISEPIDAGTLVKLGAQVEYTLNAIMKKPSERADNQHVLFDDQVTNNAVLESVERDLDRVGGRNLKAKIRGEIIGRAPVILEGALGRRRDKSDYTPESKMFSGTIRGLINEPSQRCLLFRPSEGAVIEIHFAEGQIDTQINLEQIAQLNKFQTQCAVEVSVTVGQRGQAVYTYIQIEAEPPPEALLAAQ